MSQDTLIQGQIVEICTGTIRELHKLGVTKFNLQLKTIEACFNLNTLSPSNADIQTDRKKNRKSPSKQKRNWERLKRFFEKKNLYDQAKESDDQTEK